MQPANDQRRLVSAMNPSSIHKYELKASTDYTEDGSARASVSEDSIDTFRNLLVVQTPKSRRRSSSTMTTASWHDSMENFTDGEDFLIGSPAHANHFREEVNSAGSVRRVKTISLDDPARSITSAISLPLALEPRSDSPERIESEDHYRKVDACRSGSARRERRADGISDTDGRRSERKKSSKKKNHKKKRDCHKDSSLHSKSTEEKTSSSRKKDRARSKRRAESRARQHSENKLHQNEMPQEPSRAKSTTKERHHVRGRDLMFDFEMNVEKVVCDRVLSLSLDKPKKLSKSHKKSPRRRRQTVSNSTDDDGGSAVTEATRKRIQETHILAMQMLHKARQSEPKNEFDRP